MATLAELEQAYSTLQTIFRNDITPRFNAIRREVDAGATFAQVGSDITSIRSEFNNAYGRIFEYRQLAEQITPRPTDFIARLDTSLNTRQAQNNAALATLEINARENQTRQEQQAQTATGPTASSEVTDTETNSPARPPATVVGPGGTVITPRATTTPTNADPPATAVTGDVDSGTDAPVKTLEQTQATSSQPLGQGAYRLPDGSLRIDINGVGDQTRDEQIGSGGAAGTVGVGPSSVFTASGAGANDDVTQLNDVVVSASRSQAAPGGITITPRDNVLDRFHNYTYTASVYVLTPEQFAAYQAAERRSVSGYNLLFQSGGAGVSTGEAQGAAAGRANSTIKDNRNPNFPLDYYIDSIQIDNLVFGKATQAAHSVTNLKFTVVEPNGITLLDNIYRAVQDLNPTLNNKVNYAAATYLMVIRFYGYDLNGKPVRVGAASDETGLTDPDAVVEKFIPFRIRYINWTIQNRLVSYDFDCTAIGQIVAAGSRRGTIPADIEISGSTVKSMLQGDAVYSAAQAPAAAPGATTTGDPNQSDAETARLRRQANAPAPAPSKATAASSKKGSLISGLIAAVNAKQKELVDKGEYEKADQYVLEFAPGAEAIADATVTKPGRKTAKDFTAGTGSISSGNTSGLSPDKQRMDVTSRNFAIPAGTQLVQAIDQIIRNSNYVTDQALIVFDEKTNKPRLNPKVTAESGFRWFNILMSATPLEYDNKRNDFAFQIKYVIVPYQPQEFYSEFFPVPRFQGLHKRYPYWFTGENTQVLDYQASFNKLFTLTVTGGSPGDNPLQRFRDRYTTSQRDVPFIQHQARSAESDVGADGRANDLAANAAEYLYNPTDNGQAKIRILGDPAWIQQGSAAGVASQYSVSFDPFGPDGTINYDVNDVLFEIAWQRPEDYDQNKGIADPYSRTQQSFQDRQPIQSVIYRARKVTSYFTQGRFEQDLEGTLYWFPLPDGKNRAAGTPVAAENDSSREQLLDGAALTPNATTAALSQSAKLGTGSLGLKPAAQLGLQVPTITTDDGQFAFPAAPQLGLQLPPSSDGLLDGVLGSASDTLGVGVNQPPASTAALIAQANERNRLNSQATAARQNYERVLAANNNDRSNPDVQTAFVEFQRANREALAAVDGTPVPSAPTINTGQIMARES